MTHTVEIHGIKLTVEHGGAEVRMTLKDDAAGTLVWCWPRESSPHFPTIGEELAQALALVDGTFSVHSRR